MNPMHSLQHVTTRALLLACMSLLAPVAWALGIGQVAPDFSLPTVNGKTVRLSEFTGRYVVLEWVNPECPYVQKHYRSANMPNLQREFVARNVVWLSINSTTASHPEYKSPADMADWMKSQKAGPSATLIDRDSKVGRLYAARTTPHMYVVDPKGKLIYMGAIDDKRSTQLEDVQGAKNFVRVALAEAMAGKPVSESSTTPYGCSVKY